MPYIPVSKRNAGFAAYFVPMMLDTDRNEAYRRAIAAAVADFQRDEGRAPVVLDLGCGTGLLSQYALEAGAGHVIAADTNPVAVHLTRQALRDHGRKVTVVNEKAEDYLQAKGKTVDMVVTEIFGTLHTTESWEYYMSKVRPHLNTFAGGKVYCVPQSAWTQLRPCYVADRPNVVGKYRAAVIEEMGSATDGWIASNTMGMLLYSTGDIDDPVVVPGSRCVRLRTDSFETMPAFGHRELQRGWQTVPWPERLEGAAVASVVVLEFESKLWGEHMLHNTVPHYAAVARKYGDSAAIGKHTAWGFLFTYADDSDGQCTVKLGKYGSGREEAAGVPGLKVCGRDVEPQIRSPGGLENQLQDTFSRLAVPYPDQPMLFESGVAAIIADHRQPGVHGIQVRGMKWGWFKHFLDEHTKLRVFTGGKRTLDETLAPAPAVEAHTVPTLLAVDLDALAAETVSREALLSGLITLVPEPRAGRWSQVPAPDIADHEGGMRLEAWCLPGRDQRGAHRLVVHEQQVTRADGVTERILTAPTGSVQRKHALTGVSAVARAVALPEDAPQGAIPEVVFSKSGRVKLA